MNAVARYNSIEEADRDLARDMADLADDPLEFVYYQYPWGSGDLEGQSGPDVWQAGFLRELGEEIRARGFNGIDAVLPVMTSTTSGHGVGKSALVGWLSNFMLSTRPRSKGRVTANSLPQLEAVTWPEIVKWHKLGTTRRWFHVTSGRGAQKIVYKKNPEAWRLEAVAWDEHRPAAFAGKHAVDSSTYYIFDEASEVARIILETAQGGLTDGEPFMFLFGNPTRPNGYFFDTHNALRHRFKTFQVDSRTSKIANKALIEQWIADFGLDSDFVKVRVLGEFPVTGNRQFIPSNLVTAAMDDLREPSWVATDPVILGVDVARFGMDESTIYVRRGRDLRSTAPKHFRQLDTVQLAHEVRKLNEELLADAINIDGGYGHGVIDVLNSWGVPNVNEIHFGGTSPDEEYADMATYMHAELRKWLKLAGTCLPNDPILFRQLTNREYDMIQGKRSTVIRLESKEAIRKTAETTGRESPDRGDGVVLTFAVPVAARSLERTRAAIYGIPQSNVIGTEYDRYAERG